MGLNDIKKELNKLDKNQLIELISDLYKKNKSAKEFFDFYVRPNEKVLFEKYRDKIFESFYPRRGFGYNLKNGRQAISDFKKLGSSLDFLCELMLFYVETGVSFTKDYGDINENFYLSLEKMYTQALGIISEEDLFDKFKNQACKIAELSSGIGWGFHDFIMEVYISYYPDDIVQVD